MRRLLSTAKTTLYPANASLKKDLTPPSRLDNPNKSQRKSTARGLSHGHFIRAFKQTTGLPPYRRLLQERIKQVQIYLSSTAMPLVDIALQCGFADQAHMTRIFTKRMGISPNAWRRQHRQ